jgi:hypothetical protein
VEGSFTTLRRVFLNYLAFCVFIYNDLAQININRGDCSTPLSKSVAGDLSVTATSHRVQDFRIVRCADGLLVQSLPWMLSHGMKFGTFFSMVVAATCVSQL